GAGQGDAGAEELQAAGGTVVAAEEEPVRRVAEAGVGRDAEEPGIETDLAGEGVGVRQVEPAGRVGRGEGDSRVDARRTAEGTAERDAGAGAGARAEKHAPGVVGQPDRHG